MSCAGQEMVEVCPDKDFWGRKEPRFGAAAMSLDELLQYDEDDNKEGAFEVAAFAELFREMLEARFGRGLARCLAAIGAKEREVCFSPAQSPLGFEGYEQSEECWRHAMAAA